MAVTDTEIREAMHLAPAIASAVARRTGRHHLTDELTGGCTEALARAVARFDPSQGVPFMVYARLRMNGGAWDVFRTWHGRYRDGAYANERPGAATFDPTMYPDSAELFGHDRSPEDIVIATEELHELAAAIHALTPARRDALMAASRGERQSDVAERHGITEGRVSQMRSEAMRQLGVVSRRSNMVA